jgi:hypothetical protein
LPTAHTFHHADVAVVAFSTIMFERLGCGYKTIIGNYSIPSFPMDGSPLENIVFRDSDAFRRLLKHALSVSRTEFFSKAGLSDYPLAAQPGVMKMLQ